MTRGARVVHLGLAWLLLAVALQGLPSVEAGSHVLRDYRRADFTEDDDDFTFNVPSGTNTIEIRVIAGDADVGFVRIEMFPGSITPGPGAQVVELTVQPGREETQRVSDPASGTWFVDVAYEQGFDGDARIIITDGGGFRFAGIDLGENFLDILGILISLVIVVGGAIAYRRHTTFLSRHLDTIDDTFRSMQDDVDRCRTEMESQRETLNDLLTKGKVREAHYLILERRIDTYLSKLDRVGGVRPGLASGERWLEFE